MKIEHIIISKSETKFNSLLQVVNNNYSSSNI